MVWPFYLMWLAMNIATNLIAAHIVPYSGAFPYIHILVSTHLDPWFYSRANFDGIHYILIAQQGYSQYEQAFFPLYSLFIKAVQVIVKNYLIAGLIVSVTSFSLSLIVLRKFFTGLFNGSQSSWIIGLLLVFPSAFYFTTVYTEGLFLLLLSLTLYFLYQKNWYMAAYVAFFASLTRFIGVFLIIPFATVIIIEDIIKKPSQGIARYWLSFSPVLGLLTYMLYLHLTSGDSLYFLHSEPAFGANRSASIILLPQVLFRYAKILEHSDLNFPFVVAIFELATFLFTLFVLLMDLWQTVKTKLYLKSPIILGINLFSFANLLLPTLTGTFSSVPRYVLFSLSMFMFLGRLKTALGKIIIGTIFFILQIIMFTFFIQGYFVS